MLRLRIKEVAEKEGWNMSDLSRASDIHFTTIKRLWTKPYSGVQLHTLERIAHTIGCPISDLYEEVPNGLTRRGP